MKKTILLLAALAMGQLATSQLAFAAPTIVAGVAKNGTQGNRPFAGATVQLTRRSQKGQENTVVATTRTDALGRFRFPAREYGANEILVASISHQGFDYGAFALDTGNQLKTVNVSVNPQKVDLLVFDGTSKQVPLSFQVHHLAIASSDGGLKVVERIVVENPSKTTFRGYGPRQISVLLDIPKIAKNVQLDPKITDAKLINTPSGWGVVKPITPDAYGARNAIIVNYDVAWPTKLPWGKTVDLSHKILYPTKFFFVARTTEDKGLQVTAPRLSADTEAPPLSEEDTKVRLVNSIGAPMMPAGGAPPALGANQTVEVNIAKPVNPLFWGFTAMTVALCLFLPLAMVKPRGKASVSKPKAKKAEPSYGALVSEPTSARDALFPALNGFGTDLALTSNSRELIQKIADLDDLREAGKIGETDYQTRRATWKKQLIESLGSEPHH
ncbi:MAG TPA: carboxypeptidase-like regulatory domain-containing protein [Abditibacterium sp.]|jgi:hypothetical protein